MKIHVISFLLFFSILSGMAQYRYTSPVFSSSTKNADVVYGTADFLNSPFIDETSTTVGNLVMDIYTPTGDTETNRPAIIFAHCGGFVEGDRNHQDMVAFCDTFARRGYVTATIDYRQGVYTLSDAPLHYTRAVYRGMQDGRTAVRFLRANAATYGIDPDKIYFAGSSAGAFIGLQNIYMDDLSEKPPEAGETSYGSFPTVTAPDLGDYDVGDNLGYTGEPDAVMALWGAIQHTDLITVDDNQPVLLIHGTADAIVPFDVGSPFQVATFPATYGSNPINNALETFGLTNKETYFVEGEGHEFYGVTNGDWNNGTGGNAYWDTVVDMTNLFFYRLHKPTAEFSTVASGLTVNFTDLSTGAISWEWDFGDGNQSSAQNPSHTYSNADDYNVSLYIENDNKSWDTISTTINVSEGIGIGNIKEKLSVYPNPADEIIVLDYGTEFKVALFDLTGKKHVDKQFMNGHGILDISNLSCGVYLLNIYQQGKTIVKKIIIE
jgi:acetyl esterase/lipase